MKTFVRIIIAGLCCWVLWIMFSSTYLTNVSGSTSWGGFPVSDRVELYDYLAQRGFTSVTDTNQPGITVQPGIAVERFCGRYQGSRPFFVTVMTQATNRFGICVATDYHFSGFVRSAKDSSAKVEEFTQALDGWLGEHRMRKMNTSF